ncbi:hypothetical protein [Hymenobacter rubripertinctus]|uniref:TonB-dependent receptor n=1 Tax=Hymenobacter rubripertinctus TaxID=2029981 RepID=A0A418R649_9BACT|nr:hypothetical protein [Hymenobacter rubripertinctus]RIY12933.1 hypothetical protein D0T11_04185 [Hymenobacter rubripertinctus]
MPGGEAIINIITAKGRKLGTNGVATLGAGPDSTGATTPASTSTTVPPLSMCSVASTARKTRCTAPPVPFVAWGEGVELRESGREVRHAQNNSAKLRFGYALSKNSSAGVLLKGAFSNRDRDLQNLARLSNNVLLAASQVTTEGAAQFLSPSVNVYYKTKLDTAGRTLSLNADYLAYRKNWRNDYTTQALDGNLQETGPADQLRDNSPARNVGALGFGRLRPAPGQRPPGGRQMPGLRVAHDRHPKQGGAEIGPHGPQDERRLRGGRGKLPEQRQPEKEGGKKSQHVASQIPVSRWLFRCR